MDERAKRIVDTAIELAEREGYAAVRLRDVATQAQVALGTVYRRFRSKEDILVAALEQEFARLHQRYNKRPPAGDTEHQRLSAFFQVTTRTLCRRPNLTRALLRAVASGEPEISQKVTRFHAVMTGQIAATILGLPAGSTIPPGTPGLERAQVVAMLLQHVWFASLVGWAGGLHDQNAVLEQVDTAATLLLRGSEHP